MRRASLPPSAEVAGTAVPIRIVPRERGNCAKQCQQALRKKCQLAETMPLHRPRAVPVSYIGFGTDRG
jgi:hypothetical protein